MFTKLIDIFKNEHLLTGLTSSIAMILIISCGAVAYVFVNTVWLAIIIYFTCFFIILFFNNKMIDLIKSKNYD